MQEFEFNSPEMFHVESPYHKKKAPQNNNQDLMEIFEQTYSDQVDEIQEELCDEDEWDKILEQFKDETDSNYIQESNQNQIIMGNNYTPIPKV